MATPPPADANPWRVVVLPAAEKTLRRLSRVDRQRLRSAIDRLPAGDVKRLEGGSGELRLRVGGWRVIFERDEPARVVTVLLVRSRGSAYTP